MRHVPDARRWEAERVRGHRGVACGVDELGDAAEPGVIAGVGGAVAQELACHEQRGLRSRRISTSKRRGRGGVAIRLHGRVEGGRLLLPRSGVGSDAGGAASTVVAGDGLCLGHPGSSARVVLAASVGHGSEEEERTKVAPLPGAPNVGAWAPDI